MFDDQGQLQIYTYFPFDETYVCHNTIAKLYHSFEEMMITYLPERRLFFPDKVNNLHGCTVKLALVNYPPFITFHREKVDDGDEVPQNISGVEGKLLLFLSESMNFSMSLVPEVYFFGTLFANGTGTGILGKVRKAFTKSSFTPSFML